MSPSNKNLLIGFLALTTVAASAVAFLQNRNLKALQASTSLAATERADWQKRVWDAEKRASDATAGMQSGPVIPGEAGGASAGEPTPGEVRSFTFNGRGGGRGRDAMAIMNSPEFSRMMAMQQKAALDGRYANLFRRLNLSPAEIERFKDLLVERQSVAMDVMAAAREQGLDGPGARGELRQLISENEADVNAQIEQLLGTERFSQYQNYEQTQPQRNVVSQLETRLSYSATPLQTSQAEQLVQILAQTSPVPNNPAAANVNFITAAAPRGAAPIAQAVTVIAGAGSQITDEAVNQAQSILAADQLAALKQIQAEQQAQRAMAESLRAGRGGP